MLSNPKQNSKKPNHIWLAVILTNIGFYLSVAITLVYYREIAVLDSLLPIPIKMIAYSLFVTIVPTLISKSNSRLRHWFGYGIPALLLILVPFLYSYTETCYIYPCNLGSILVYIGLLAAAPFLAIYTLADFSRRWSWFSRVLVSIESILLLGIICFLGYFVYLDYSLMTVKTRRQTDFEKIIKICEKMPEGRRQNECREVFAMEEFWPMEQFIETKK